jgi:iron complex transport system substrate-binding protein
VTTVRSALRATRLAAPAAAVALVLAACGGTSDAGEAASSDPAGSASASGPLTVEHAQGSTEIEGTPEKVFVFDFAAAAVMQEIGVEIDGIPKSNPPAAFEDLAADEDVVDVGTLFEPDYETIAAEAPDLIVVAGRSAAAYPQLAEIAPTVDLSNDWTDNVASSEENALKIGEIFGKTAEAQQLVDELDATVAEVAGKAEGAGDALIVLTSGGKVTAYGPGGRFGFLHDQLGFAPAAEVTEEAQHGQAISFEFIAENDPDWIFVIDRDAATGEGSEAAEQVMDNELVNRTKAARDDRVVYVDPTSWYVMGGGVVALQQIADDVSAVLDEKA